MPKATEEEITDFGFDGSTYVESDWSGYLSRILATAELRVRNDVGDSVYDSALSGTLTFARIARLETLFTAQELFGRAETIALREIRSGDVFSSKGDSPAIAGRNRARDEYDNLLLQMGFTPPLWSVDFCSVTAGQVNKSSHFAEDQP